MLNHEGYEVRSFMAPEASAVIGCFSANSTIYDGTVTLLADKPKDIGARSQECFHLEKGSHGLNNLIQVDSQGLLTTAIIGAPASVSDSTLL